MVAIPWPTSTSPGSRPQEGAGRLINAFVVPRGENIGGVYHRVPGVLAFGQQANINWTWESPGLEWFNQPSAAFVPTGSFRGGVAVGGTFYGAFGEKVYTLDAAGNYDEIGNLAGSDRVYFARNNNVIPQVVAVCDAGPFQITPTAVLAYPDLDVGAPNSVCFHDGYFIFTYGDGTVVASEINSTNINPLSFASAESNVDGLVRAWSYLGLLYLAGPATIEVWGGPPNPAPAFPLSRKGYNISPGLIAANAVAGFEAEFSSPIYCASDHTVRSLDGYTPVKISPPELDQLLQIEADNNAIEAMCYVADGHHFWQLSSSTWSWVYNVNYKTWHERKSYLSTRSRFTNASVFIFDEWMVGDTDSGFLLIIAPGVTTEAGDPLVFTAESKPVKQFPNRVRVARADFDFVMGVGDADGSDPIQTDPTVVISYSDDGGYSWSVPYQRKLGRQAKTMKRIILPPTGMSGTQGRRWRVAVADPVWVGLMGGDMYAALARK
jgi:hypothetical protein